MDINDAKRLVINRFKVADIEKEYSGFIGDELVFAFVFNRHFILVYEDGSIAEITNPTIISSILKMFTSN